MIIIYAYISFNLSLLLYIFYSQVDEVGKIFPNSDSSANLRVNFNSLDKENHEKSS